MRIMLLFWLTVACVTPAFAQTTVYRDSQQNFRGTSTQSGGVTTYRDKANNVTGTDRVESGQLVHRDAKGDRQWTAGK